MPNFCFTLLFGALFGAVAASSWPSGCFGPSFSAQDAQRLLGPGGSGPVSLGSSISFRASWRACNNITGCGNWQDDSYLYTSVGCSGGFGDYTPKDGPELAIQVRGSLQLIPLVQDIDPRICFGGVTSVSNYTSPIGLVAWSDGCCSIEAGSVYAPIKTFLLQGAVTSNCVSLFSPVVTVGPRPEHAGNDIQTRFFIGGPITYPSSVRKMKIAS